MNNYWIERQAKEREKLLDRNIADLEREIRENYKKSAKRLKQKVQALFIELEQAKQDGTLLLSDLFKYNRYYEFLNVVNKELSRLEEKELQLYGAKFRKLYIENGKMLNQQLGLTSKLDKGLAERAINAVWCADNKTWDMRVWGNRQTFQKELRQTLLDCVATGKNYQEASAEFAKQFGKAYYKAERLIRTEMAHIQTASTLEKYKEAGIEEYEVILEDNACDDCVNELKDQRFSLDNQKIPLHANCRCCAIPVIKTAEVNTVE